MILLNILISLVLVNLFLSYITKNHNVLYCGLVAFSGTEDFDPAKIKQLMLANMWRGQDSTGVWSPRGGLTKTLDRVDLFLADEEIVPGNLFLGHVRKATVGGATDPKTAHPFSIENLVGMHNGTIVNHRDIARKRGLEWDEYKVDSEAILWGLQQHGDWDALKEIDGAAALIWTYIDRDEDELYIFRNSERPLFRGFHEEGMYISSTRESLEIIECTKIREFKTDYLYVIEEGEFMGKVSKVVRKPKPKPTKYDLRKKAIEDVKHNEEESFKSAPILNMHGHWDNIEKAKLVNKIGRWAQVTSTAKNSTLTYGEMYRILDVFPNGILALSDGSGINAVGEEDCIIRDYPSTGDWAIAVIEGSVTKAESLVYVISEQISPDENNVQLDFISYNIVGEEELGTVKWEPHYFACITEEDAFKLDDRARKTPRIAISKVDPTVADPNEEPEVDDDEILTVTEFYKNLIKFGADSTFDEKGNVLGDKKGYIGSVITDVLNLISLLEAYEDSYFTGEGITVSDMIAKLGTTKDKTMESLNEMVDGILEDMPKLEETIS